MNFPFKQYFKKTFPRTFIKIRDIKDQIVIEFNTLKQIGVRKILCRFLRSKEQWKKDLPVQSIEAIKVDIVSLETLCKKAKDIKEGGHTFYLPPTTLKNLPFENLLRYIPDNVGIKIVKRKGGINAPFAAPDKTCRSHSRFSPSHKDLILIHNLFYNLGIGPKLYDLVEIEFQNHDQHVAYLIEHIEGISPSTKDCELFIKQLRNMEKTNLIKLINWNGYKDIDFECPACNGNLIQEKKTKKLKYVDLQNFALDDYYPYLKSIAIDATKASHFGQKSYLMGGDYLYQEIPGIHLGAKRSPALRFQVFKSLLEEAGLSFQNKLVIDIGCNLGLMGAQYLKEGAAWVHGFDMPDVIPHAEKVLSSIGCTRFSAVGSLLSDNFSLLSHLPSYLHNKTSDCIISYLAIRGHIGWIKELGKISWDFMLYEGHQEENLEESHKFIEHLNKIKKCKIVSEDWIQDGNSTKRYVAIIKSIK